MLFFCPWENSTRIPRICQLCHLWRGMDVPSVFIRSMASKKLSNRSKKVALGAANNTLEVERDPRRLPKSVKINRISLISIDFCWFSMIFIDFIDFHWFSLGFCWCYDHFRTSKRHSFSLRPSQKKKWYTTPIANCMNFPFLKSFLWSETPPGREITKFAEFS